MKNILMMGLATLATAGPILQFQWAIHSGESDDRVLFRAY